MALSALFGTSVLINTSRTVSATFSGYTPQTGDIVYFFADSGDETVAITTPSGWVNVLGGNTRVASDNNAVVGIYHVVTPAEVSGVTTSYSATNLFNSAIAGRAMCCVLRGANTNAPIGTVATVFDSTNGASPNVIPGLSGAALDTGWLVVGGVGADGLATYTDPSGWTLIAKNAASQTPVGLYYYNSLTTAGTTITSTNIAISAGSEYASITIAVIPAPSNAVQFDAVGTGATGNQSSAGQNLSISWTHIGASSKSLAVIVGVVVGYSGTTANPTVTYGGRTMTQLSVVTPPNTVGNVFLYGILNPPVGSQTVNASWTVPSAAGMCANSVSYTNVGGFGGPFTASGGSGAESVTAFIPANSMGVNVFGITANTVLGYNQTSRATNATNQALVLWGTAIGDTSTTGTSVPFSTTNTGSTWGTSCIVLHPPMPFEQFF